VRNFTKVPTVFVIENRPSLFLTVREMLTLVSVEVTPEAIILVPMTQRPAALE
jgi:hypothetical protein